MNDPVVLKNFYRLNKPAYEDGDEGKFLWHHKYHHVRVDPDLNTIQSCDHWCSMSAEDRGLEDIELRVYSATPGASSNSFSHIGFGNSVSISICLDALILIPEIANLVPLLNNMERTYIIFLMKLDGWDGYRDYIKFGYVEPESFDVGDELPKEWRARFIRDTIVDMFPDDKVLPLPSNFRHGFVRFTPEGEWVSML